MGYPYSDGKIKQLNDLLDDPKIGEIDSIVTDIIRKGWFLESWINDLLYKENLF